MHLRAPFSETDHAKLRAFIHRQRFATVVSAGGDSGPVASHLPVDIEGAGFGTLIAHMARNNPHIEYIEAGQPMLVIFSGPDAYISPSVFPERRSAPTQAHCVVHCYGQARLVYEPGELRAIMERQVASREGGKWDISELGEAGYARRLAAIAGIVMPIERMLGSFRLLQDEPVGNVNAAVVDLRARGEELLAQAIISANAGRCPLAGE